MYPIKPRFKVNSRKRLDHIFQVRMRAQLQVSSAVPSLSDPRYRIRAHAIGSSKESDGFTASLSPPDFCNLMRREQWLPPHFDAGTFRSFTAFRGPRLDQLSFEFSKTAQHRKHAASGRRKSAARPAKHAFCSLTELKRWGEHSRTSDDACPTGHRSRPAESGALSNGRRRIRW